MPKDNEREISAEEGASWFGLSRHTFYAFAEKQGIRLVAEKNPSRTRQIRRYVRADAERVYRDLYGKEPPQSTPQTPPASYLVSRASYGQALTEDAGTYTVERKK